MTSGWTYQESLMDREVVGRLVTHILYSKNFEAAPIHPDDVIESRAEDGALSEFCPSIQVPKQTTLSELPDQVNKDELHK